MAKKHIKQKGKNGGPKGVGLANHFGGGKKKTTNHIFPGGQGGPLLGSRTEPEGPRFEEELQEKENWSTKNGCKNSWEVLKRPCEETGEIFLAGGTINRARGSPKVGWLF